MHEDVGRHLVDALERTTDLVGALDGASHVVYLNEAARKRLGIGDAQGLTSADLFSPDVFGRYYSEIRPALVRDGTWSGELSIIDHAGTSLSVSMTIVGTVEPGGEVTGLVLHGREIDSRSATTHEDELTGLPSRSLFRDRAHVALARARRERSHVAVVFVDIDAMKDINDTYGHEVGDEVLRVLARRMVRAVRASDTVARIGGDEFVVLLDGVADEASALALTERVRRGISRASIETREGPLSFTASLGLAVGDAESTPDELVRRADAAMYRAKAQGSGQVGTFDAGARVSVTALLDELAVSVSQGRIQPHAQPVVDLRTEAIVGYQGLARWDRPHEGLMEAERFVDLAADTPMATVIDLAVLRRTAAAVARLRRDGEAVVALGHASRRLIGDPGVEHYVAEITERLGLAPANVGVEVAQPLVTRRSRAVHGGLRALRELGATTVLSDVDGEIDVAAVAAEGFDGIRLAPRLTLAARHDAAAERVLRGTIALAHGLGLTVTAVGVEREDDREWLADLGCDRGQGWLFGEVLPCGVLGGGE